MDSKSLMNGFFTGFLIGSFAALLSAPASGRQTLNNIRNFDWKTLNQRASTKGKEAVQVWQDATTEGFEAMNGLTKEMKRTYSRYKEEVEPEVEAIQLQVKEISDAIAELNEKIRNETK